MSWFVVDVEADGPAPGLFSMVSFGVVKVSREAPPATFYGQTRPISERWVEEALAVSGFTREQHLGFDDPMTVMSRFADWIAQESVGRPIFISDNPAFDWSFINYYFHAFSNGNPFGHSARRIGDIYSGLVNDPFAASKWKSMRKTAHTHHPVDDAQGNVEALLAIAEKFSFAVPTK